MSLSCYLIYDLLFSGKILNNFFSLSGGGAKSLTCFDLFLPQVRHYAARKGTRMKAQKKKVKVEVKKLGFIPHNLRVKNK